MSRSDFVSKSEAWVTLKIRATYKYGKHLIYAMTDLIRHETFEFDHDGRDYVISRVGSPHQLQDGSVETNSYWVGHVYLKDEDLTEGTDPIINGFEEGNIIYDGTSIPETTGVCLKRRALNYPSRRVLGFEFKDKTKTYAINTCRELIWFLNRRLE